MKIALAILSTAVLICLVAYIYLAHAGTSHTLYSTVNKRLVTVPGHVFLVLSAIGGLTCLYQGAEALLFWVPHSFGPFDGAGVGLRVYLAGAFAFYSGICFLIFVDRATHNAFFLREANTERRELKRVLAAAGSPARLRELTAEFEDKVSTLSQRLGGQDITEARAHPDGQMLVVYRELLAVLRARLQSLPSEA
jgi:hypothetical protein